jgi:cytochrome c551/c552
MRYDRQNMLGVPPFSRLLAQGCGSRTGGRGAGTPWCRGLIFALFLAAFGAKALDIQLPPETAAFKQDTGVEIANGQCLICHSVEYVTMQPPMARAFWKSSVQKMQQKYGAPITDAQVDPVVDYLTRNYGVSTNGAQQVATGIHPQSDSGKSPGKLDGLEVAAKYFCLSCHSPAAKVGPQYRDIAAKYKNDPNALARIDEQIHKGGTGKWGPIIMPPFPQVSPAETRALAEWILVTK